MKKLYIILAAGIIAPGLLMAQEGYGAVKQLENIAPVVSSGVAEAGIKSEPSLRLTTKELEAKNKAAAAGALPARSVTELELPEYCRINDKDLNALVEDVMTRQSPRDPATNNLFIKLTAAAQDGKSIQARIVNVKHAHPGDQFHIEVYVAGKLLFKSGRQDNPVYIGFQVDDVPYSLVCFEDIPE